MSNQDLMIGVSILSQHVEPMFTPEMSLKDKLKICYRESFKEGNTWFVRHDDDDLRMRIGIGALLTIVEKDSIDYETIERSLTVLKSLSALLSGVPVDLSIVLPEDPEELIPLLPIYQEVKAEASAGSRSLL